MYYRITKQFLSFFQKKIDIVTLQANLRSIAGLDIISKEDANQIFSLTESIEGIVFSTKLENYDIAVQDLFVNAAMKSRTLYTLDSKICTQEKYEGYKHTLTEASLFTGDFPCTIKDTIANYILPTDVKNYFLDDVLDEFLTLGIIDQKILQKSIKLREAVLPIPNYTSSISPDESTNLASELLHLLYF